MGHPVLIARRPSHFNTIHFTEDRDASAAAQLIFIIVSGAGNNSLDPIKKLQSL
jgi:hypothetical protein